VMLGSVRHYKEEELKGSEWNIRNEAFRDLGSALSVKLFPFVSLVKGEEI